MLPEFQTGMPSLLMNVNEYEAEINYIGTQQTADDVLCK
jgi:hypothetical protein